MCPANAPQPPEAMCSAVQGYHILGRIGSGAYGEVFQVSNPSIPNLPPTLAMKRCAMRNDEEGIPQSVLREVSILMAMRNFRHPNLVAIYEAFISSSATDGKRLNIVYEKCEWNLQEFLYDIPQDMHDRQCMHLARQMFAGLDFLHTHSIIHRDIKTQNILINRDQCVKIADFGLARSYGLCATFTPVSVTLTYRAPELILQANYDSTADIWSAGCILLELYMRRPIFETQPATEANQLLTIFRKRGTPSKHYWPEGAVIEHSFYSYCPPVPLQRIAPKASDLATQLAEETLRFSAHLRPSAAECLKHPYFN